MRNIDGQIADRQYIYNISTLAPTFLPFNVRSYNCCENTPYSQTDKEILYVRGRWLLFHNFIVLGYQPKHTIWSSHPTSCSIQWITKQRQIEKLGNQISVLRSHFSYSEVVYLKRANKNIRIFLSQKRQFCKLSFLQRISATLICAYDVNKFRS